MKNLEKKFCRGGESTFYKKVVNILILLLIVLISTNTYAGTDGEELQSAYDKLMGMISGTGGKIIAAVSGLAGLCGIALKFNWPAIATFFGVTIGIGTVQTVVDTTVTCLLNF